MFLSISIPEALTIVQRLARAEGSLLRQDPFRVVADRVEVHPRTVYKWSTGESLVPEDRKDQVIQALVDLAMDTPQLLKEASDALAAIARAEADGEISPMEFAAIHDELREVVLVSELVRLGKLRRSRL
jgi:hypothetical protein